MKKDDGSGFKLPKQLLTQLDECTRGFFLLTVDDKGGFVVYQSYHDPLTEMGVTNCLNMHFNALQEVMRNETLDAMMEESDETFQEEDNSDDKENA